MLLPSPSAHHTSAPRSVAMVDKTSSTSRPFNFIKRDDETYSFLPAAAAICGLNFNFSVREMSTACLRHTLSQGPGPSSTASSHQTSVLLKDAIPPGIGEPHIAHPLCRLLFCSQLLRSCGQVHSQCLHTVGKCHSSFLLHLNISFQITVDAMTLLSPPLPFSVLILQRLTILGPHRPLPLALLSGTFPQFLPAPPQSFRWCSKQPHRTRNIFLSWLAISSASLSQVLGPCRSQRVTLWLC